MNLQLFSSPGDDLRDVLVACSQVLEGREDPLVAHLPAASLSNKWQGYTENAFLGLARVATINTELQTLLEMEAILREASLVYIPGGNTFLLNHRLHISKIMDYLRKKVTAGLPLVAFSAGTVLCGPNILTSKDMNMVETPYFSGLNTTSFNFSVHYPDDEISRLIKDDWLVDYHVFHDNPLILMADDAYVHVEGKKSTLVRGDAWILRKGQQKQKLEPGQGIPASVNT
jgi:peptidase E